MEKSAAKPLVTVIVPSYNHINYVEQCIKSIVEQTYTNIQLIVIDDGSTDGSMELIRNLSQQYNFEFYSQKNHGIVFTLNKALREYTKGYYVSLCASDDYYTNDRIEKQVEYLQKNHGYAMCYSSVYIINNSNEITGIMHSSEQSGILYESFLNGKLNIPALSCFYKKNILFELGLYDESAIVEDSYMLSKILKSYEVGHLKIMAGYYRRHQNNFSEVRMVEMYNENMSMIKKLYSDHPSFADVVQKSRLMWFYQLSQKNKREAKKLLLRISVKHYFSKYFIGGILNLIGLKIKKNPLKKIINNGVR